ncbi:hypothetical protein [Clavibacter nebraskensis]|uniref:hypothetical protein n=1 Tax=Clavibacter nebraskensis TaxID=31963 RepID=UPI003F8545DB
MSIKPSEWANTLSIAVSDQLQQQLSASPWKYPKVPTDTVAESVYVNYLLLLRRELKAHQVTSVTLLEKLDALRAFAATEDFDKMIELYKVHQRAIYGWANAEARRGRVFFAEDTEVTDEQSQELLGMLIERGDAAAYIVNVPGTIDLVFDWDYDGGNVSVEAARALASRAVLAFTSQSKADLIQYFDGIRAAIINHSGPESKLAETVERELDQHARLQIDILVSNPGRSGVSLDATAAAVIGLKGYKYKELNEGNVRSVESDVRLALSIVTESHAEYARSTSLEALSSRVEARTIQAPIVLQPGSTVRLIGTSRRLLRHYKNGAAVHNAYAGSERSVRIEVRRFRRPPFFRRQNIDSVKHVKSRNVVFKDLNIDSRVADHES